MNYILKIMKCREDAIIPKQATSGSAGYDIYACNDETVTIHPGKTAVIQTGICMHLPHNTAGLIYTRSGLGIKHGIRVTNGVGVIDSDYRGEVRVGLHNISDKIFEVNKGDRVAQLVISPVIHPEIIEVTELDFTERGDKGFGSTGYSSEIDEK